MTAPKPSMSIKSPTLHATILFTIAVFAVSITMAFVFRVEVVAQGQGKVVPTTRVQTVQPEFGGKITAIHVRNGDVVDRGDLLIGFDQTDAMSELSTVQAEAVRLRLELARVTALVDTMDAGDLESADLVAQALARFDEGASTDDPLAREQASLLAAEVEDLQAALRRVDAERQANESAKNVTRANADRIEAALALQAERLAVAESLVERGTTSRASYLDTLQTFTALEKERDVYLRELDQKDVQDIALQVQYRSVITAKRTQLLGRKAEIDGRLATLSEEMRAAERRVLGSDLRAPVAGTVDQLNVFTIGGVAEAGEELMRIVPADSVVEIEATFTNQDIGFMQVGQRANIGLDAYPSERFGFLKGTVVDIAADATEIETGTWGYIAQIKPDGGSLEFADQTFPLRPGMTGRVDVTTDDRRIISYFFAPIMKTIEGALGER